jgi:hypothetical protein
MKDLHPDALRVLELAHEERTPSEADKARIEGKLALAVGAAALASGAVTSTASSAAAQGALSGLAAKPAAAAMKLWLAGSAAVLTVVTASYVLTRGPDDVKVERAQRVTEQAPAVLPQLPQPEAATPTLEPQAIEPVAPLPPARAHKPKRDKHTLATELELLHAAQAAWRARDAREALALVKAHRARYPRSQLALERDAIHVLSLCELGRKDEARALGRALIARAPNSPLRASIEQSCIVR